MQLTIKTIGTFEVSNLSDASMIYCDERDMSGEGVSTFPEGKLSNGMRISYNGRVWDGDTVVCEAAA